MDPTLEKEVNRLGRSSRIAAGITVLGVIGVALAMFYATSQLRRLQDEIEASQAKLKIVNQERDQATAQVKILREEIKNAEAEKEKYQEEISELKKLLSVGHSVDLSMAYRRERVFRTLRHCKSVNLHVPM